MHVILLHICSCYLKTFWMNGLISETIFCTHEYVVCWKKRVWLNALKSSFIYTYKAACIGKRHNFEFLTGPYYYLYPPSTKQKWQSCNLLRLYRTFSLYVTILFQNRTVFIKTKNSCIEAHFKFTGPRPEDVYPIVWCPLCEHVQAFFKQNLLPNTQGYFDKTWQGCSLHKALRRRFHAKFWLLMQPKKM